MKLVVVIAALLILAGIVALLEKGMRDEDRINADAGRLREEQLQREAEAMVADIDDWRQSHNSPYSDG